MPQHILKNGDELAKAVADWMVTLIADRLKKQDRFTLVLSGGSTPRKLYQLLAAEQYRRQIPWEKLHFFWGDERFVPFTDDKSNAKMAFDELLDRVPVVHEQIHVMRTDLPAEESAILYEELLHDYFDEHSHSFDLVLLGLGDNSHTLSLFPGYPVVKEQKKWVYAFYLEEQNMYRITLTAPLVNRSAAIAFLVTGADKAAAVREVMHGQADADKHPAQLIQAKNGELHWFLDEPAAAEG